jgi:hypothetical protein
MRLAALAVAVVVCCVVALRVKRSADGREVQILAELERNLRDHHDPSGAHADLVAVIAANTRYLATIVRSLVVFIVLASAAAFASIAWLQHVSDEQQDEIRRSCRADNEFRQHIYNEFGGPLMFERDCP